MVSSTSTLLGPDLPFYSLRMSLMQDINTKESLL
jgi:hypothetical protein